MKEDFAGERRLYPRYKLDVSCDIYEEDLCLKSSTLDLSVRGISCILPNRIALFTKLRISILLPFLQDDGNECREKADCEGVVVRCEDIELEGHTRYKTAIFFNQIFEGGVERIERFIQSQQPT